MWLWILLPILTQQVLFGNTMFLLVLRPSEKFSSSSKKSKGIFELSEFKQEFFKCSKIPSKTRASTSIFSSSNFEHFLPNRASTKSFLEQSSFFYQNLTNFRSYTFVHLFLYLLSHKNRFNFGKIVTYKFKYGLYVP